MYTVLASRWGVAIEEKDVCELHEKKVDAAPFLLFRRVKEMLSYYLVGDVGTEGEVLARY